VSDILHAQDNSRTLPIAVDAMGGDRAPEEIVGGALDAVARHGVSVTLVGRSDEIQRFLGGSSAGRDRISVVDAPETVKMEEHAVAAVRRKTRASITVACEEVAEGRASAVVSAGNSGAVVASAIFSLGRLEGIERPGIAIPFPTLRGKPTYVIDAGAVVDPRPAHLLQLAHLIRDYLQDVVGIDSPRIALLSNGHEAGKGNALMRETHALLADSPEFNFAGNIEANVIPDGNVDAVVCDGFSGNVLLKTAEGTAALVQAALRNELSSRLYTKLLAAALRPSFRRAIKTLDYREYGGAPLLGVRHPVVIAHGRSDRQAISNAIVTASRAVDDGNH
jgi:glycerol-3-phosphate acyltransferase PlsX